MDIAVVMPVVGILIAVVVFGSMAFFMLRLFRGLAKATAQNQELLTTGVPAAARVLAVQMGGMTVTTGVQRHLQLVLSLEVHPAGAAPYPAQMTSMVSELQVPQLQPGSWVQVRFDRMNPTRLALEAMGIAPPGQGAAPYGAPQQGYPPAAAGYGPTPGYGPAPGYGAGPYAGGVPVAAAQMRVPGGARIGLIIGLAGGAVGLIVAIVVVAVNVLGVGTGGADGDGVCGRAAACCKVISGDSAPACNNLKKLGVPAEACQSSLDGFKQSAKAMGKSCD